MYPYYLIAGFFCFAAGAMHRLPDVARLDEQVFLFMHRHLRQDKLLRVFRALWPLGTTPFSLLICALAILFDWRIGLRFALVYLLAVSFEAGIKKMVQRRRPFNALAGVTMSQPRKPHDSSFPSGDTLRIWYVALLLPFLFPVPVGVILAGYFTALLISVGRIALGVHFSLDVLAGAGLGVLFAGIYLLPVLL